MSQRMLGRLAEFDERNLQFPLKTRLYGVSKRKKRSWLIDKIHNQSEQICPHMPGGTHFYCQDRGFCVGFGTYQVLRASPNRLKKVPSALEIYHKAQTYDQWEGERYAGTSVLGALKYLHKETNHIKEYRWTYDINAAIQFLLEHGPLLIGVNWYNGMFYPSKEGVIKPNGLLSGGHCVAVTRVNLKQGLIGFANSWGAGWGVKGFAWLDIADFERLLKEDGECAAIQENI